MIPYWLLFTIFAAGSLQVHRRQQDNRSVGLILLAAGIFTACMIGFRYQVGGDWTSYQAAYVLAGYSDISDTLDRFDPGYAILNWLGNVIGVDVWFVNFVCGIIVMWGLLKFAKREPNPWLVILVAIPYFIIVVAMGYTRQGVAIAILLAGLHWVEREALGRFMIYALVAALFHKTSIIILPLVIMAVVKRKIIVVPVAMATLVLLYYLLLASDVEELMQGYVEAEYSSQGAGVRVAMNLVPAALFLMYRRKFAFPGPLDKVWRNFAIFAFLMLVLLFATPSSTAVDRIALYVIPLQLAILARLPAAFGTEGRQNGQVMLGIIAYSAAVQYVWLTQGTYARLWVPYKVYPLW